MSSIQNFLIDLESSFYLKVISIERIGLKFDVELVILGVVSFVNVEQMRIFVIIFELFEDGGGDVVCFEDNGSERILERLTVEVFFNQCFGYEFGDGGKVINDYGFFLGDQCEIIFSFIFNMVFEFEAGREGQVNFDLLFCKISYEKRYVRVFSVDSGIDVFLCKSFSEIINEKEKIILIFKFDFEVKEG